MTCDALMTTCSGSRPRLRSRGLLLGSLLAASISALGATCVAQEGGGTAPAAPAASPAGPVEKDLLADFTKAFKSRKPPERSAAITALGDLSRTLADKGVSKPMARALAEGLRDDELEVRAAAVGQLAWGRQVDTVIAAFEDMLEDQRKQIDKRITRPDPESRDYVGRGSRLYGDACRALANYRDDRSAAALTDQIKNLRPNTDSNNLSTRIVGDLARSILSLGTADGVEATVQQTQVYSQDDGFQDSAARALHEALAEFSTVKGVAPPEFSQTYYVAWHDWFEANGKLFPKKLGKLDAPPAAAADDMGMDKPKDKNEPAPR